MLTPPETLAAPSMRGEVSRSAENVDLAIAARWPDRWARANDPNLRNRSKARNNLRKAYRHAVEYDAARDATPNARCDNCNNHFVRHIAGNIACALDSDFHGDLIVQPDGFCARYKGLFS